MTTPDVEKAAFRTIARNTRIAISEARRAVASQQACEHILDASWWPEISSIGLYAAYGSELDPKEIERRALEDGKRIYYPRVIKDEIEFVRGELQTLECGFAGIMEPAGTAVPIDTLDLIVVPGLSFDANGQRLGSGRGFYDRSLPKRSRTLGFAFVEQIVPLVPTSIHDRRMAGVVTDEGFLREPKFDEE